MKLSELPIGSVGVIYRVDGEASFRRRLLELGLLPGTLVRMLRIAPLGDPMELSARGAKLSIRANEAARVEVEPQPREAS